MTEDQDILTMDEPQIGEGNGDQPKPKPKFNPKLPFKDVVEPAKPKFDPNAPFQDADYVQPKIEFSQPSYKSQPSTRVNQFYFDKQKDESDKVLDQVKLQNQGATAHENLSNLLHGSNDVAQHLVGIDRMQRVQQLKNAADQGDMNALAQYQKESADIPLPSDLNAATEQKKQDLLANPQTTRQFVDAVAQFHPSKAPQIKADQYAVDASNRGADASKVASNVKNIKEGNLDYNIKTGQVEKQVNPVESFINGWKHKSKLFDDYDFIKSATDQELADKYEKRRTEYNPDEPVEKPSGTLGEITQMFASQPTKAMIAEGILSAIPGAEEAAPLAGATVGAYDYGRIGQATAMEQIYNEARNQGKNPLEAAQLAKVESQKAGDIDALQGAAMTGMAGKFGAKGLPNFSQGYETAVKNFLKQTGGEAATMAAIGAGGQFAKNKLAQAAGIDRPTSEGMLDQVKTNFLMTAGIKAAMAGGKFVNPIIHGLTKADPETLGNQLEQQVTEKEITPDQATELQQKVNDAAGIYKTIPDDISEASQQKIHDLLLERDNLKNVKMVALHEAFHPKIKEEIKAIDEKILKLSEDKVKPEEGVNRGTTPEDIENQNNTQDGTLPIESASSILQHPQEGTGSEGSGRERVESSQQGQESTGTQNTDQEGQGTSEKIGGPPFDLPFTGRTGEGIGISHGSAEARATDVPVLPPERGEGVTVEDAIKHGQDLLSKGGDADKAAADFKADKKISYDALSLVRAKHADLAKATNNAIDQHGEGSKQAQSTIKAESEWYKNTVKPMQTEWSKIGQAQQGETDIDTGSYMGLKRAFMQENGKEPSAQQSKEAKGLSGKVQGLTKQVEDLKQQLSDALDKATSEGSKASKPKSEKKSSGDYIKERKDALQAARDALKQLRSGQSGLGSTVPFARELAAIAPHVAKIVKSLIEEGIDKLGDIVDYVHEQFKDDILGVRRRDIIDVIAGDYNKQTEVNPNDKLVDIRKQSRLVKQLEDLQNGLPKDFDKNKTQQSPEVQALLDKIKKVKKDLDDMGYMKPSKKKVSPEERNINQLEKELDDLQQGIVKEKSPIREQSDREKELKDQIFEAKKNLGLIEPKGLPEDPHIRALEKKLEDLRAGKATNKGNERDISAQERVLQDQIKEAQNTAKANELSTRFVDKKGNDFDQEDAKDIWDYAKENYLNKGKDFDTMIHGTAMDLGLTPGQVRNALTQPKGTKQITTDMYAKQAHQRMAIQQAKAWVKNSQTPGWKKVLMAVPNLFFRVKTFGHGTVGGITHAGMNIFRPSAWKEYWPNAIKQFEFSFGGLSKKGLANYEMAMQDLIHDRDFMTAKRAGLAVDPAQKYDDYQTFASGTGLGSRIMQMGDRGFNALKTMRLAMWKKDIEGLSDSEKADPEILKSIATLVNHSTGTSHIPVPDVIGTAFFAPRLEASRWARLITDPAKAVSTVLNWKNASAADKAAAKIVGKKSAEVLIAYGAALAANQGILMATGSKQSINFTDPTSSDWLKFKIGGRTVDASGGIITALGFATKMAHIAIESKSELKGKKRGDEFVSKGGGYLRGKLSPFGSTVADLATQHDFAGNTLPFSSDKPTTKFQHQLTWREYVENQQTPIPVAEYFKDTEEQMKDKGMSEKDINTIMQGIFVSAMVGGTGVHINDDYKKNK